MDVDNYPLAYRYPAAAAAMDAVDLLDMEPRAAVLPPLSRAQLERLLQRLLFAQPNALEVLSAMLPATSGGYGLGSGSGGASASPLIASSPVTSGKSLYGGAHLLRMPMPMPEMKRTARGRSMQCYFNPISCY